MTLSDVKLFLKMGRVTSSSLATAPAVTYAVTENIVLRHGCPKIVVSDNGTQFKSAQLEKLFIAYSIRQRIRRNTTRSNVRIER